MSTVQYPPSPHLIPSNLALEILQAPEGVAGELFGDFEAGLAGRGVHATDISWMGEGLGEGVGEGACDEN